MKRLLAVIGSIIALLLVVWRLNYDWFPQNDPVNPIVGEAEEAFEVTSQMVDDFRSKIDVTKISAVEQYSNSSLLYLTVTKTWVGSTDVQRSEYAISLRDQWKSTCKCFAPILVFKTRGGVELMKIAADKPEVLD